ncbi:MAG: phosphatase [Elainella sp. C42_A2020_010]|nr:phosphatase [Elainella sp. C42_A2020_010]
MINAFQVNEYLTTTGQVIPAQLKQAVQEGFKSVLNLRSPDELGFMPEEQQIAESLGLHYVNLPLKLETLDEALITHILTVLDQIPKPAVIHCAASIRSTAIALLSVALQEGLTPEQTLARAKELGYKFANYACIDPQLKQFFSQYILKYAKVTASIS